MGLWVMGLGLRVVGFRALFEKASAETSPGDLTGRRFETPTSPVELRVTIKMRKEKNEAEYLDPKP